MDSGSDFNNDSQNLTDKHKILMRAIWFIKVLFMFEPAALGFLSIYRFFSLYIARSLLTPPLPFTIKAVNNNDKTKTNNIKL